MAYAKLHYGGQAYKLDAEKVALFQMEVTRALRAGDPVTVVDAPLSGGATLSIAVSPSIPVAIEKGGSDQGPSAAFL